MVALACSFTSSVCAQPTLRQECTDLSADDRARVEARLLASLLTPEADGVSVAITCENRIAVVTASVGPEEMRRSVALSGSVNAEAILELATRAVAQLRAAGVDEAPPAETSADRPPSEPASAEAVSGSPASTTPRAASSPPEPHPEPAAAGAEPVHLPSPAACESFSLHDSRARADIALQSWGARAALVAAVGLEQATQRYSYAFLAGAARPVEPARLSDVSEWTVAAEYARQDEALSGLRLSARLGLSVLASSPDRGVVSSSGTLKSAGFLELYLSRPIWLGRVGLVPGVGLRAYSAKRAVAIDGRAELKVLIPSALATLSLLVRVND
jgi:hypothetical protein